MAQKALVRALGVRSAGRLAVLAPRGTWCAHLCIQKNLLLFKNELYWPDVDSETNILTCILVLLVTKKKPCDGIDSRVCRGYGWYDNAARCQHMLRALANTTMGPASMASVGQPGYTALLYDLITDTEVLEEADQVSLLHGVVEAVLPTVCWELIQICARSKAAGGKFERVSALMVQ